MKVLDARINWREGWANAPDLELLVDRIPALDEMRFQVHAMWCYFAELDGYISFYIDDPHNHWGFAGRHFDLEMVDGSKVILEGPWSSRAGACNKLGLTPSVDVALTDRPEQWGSGMSLSTGHVTVVLAKEAVEKFCPDVAAEVVDTIGEPVLHFHRTENPCHTCKGAGKFIRRGDTDSQFCPRCEGTGKEVQGVR